MNKYFFSIVITFISFFSLFGIALLTYQLYLILFKVTLLKLIF